MSWELTTPWGLFSIGYFDGFLLWITALTVMAAIGIASKAKDE